MAAALTAKNGCFFLLLQVVVVALSLVQVVAVSLSLLMMVAVAVALLQMVAVSLSVVPVVSNDLFVQILAFYKYRFEREGGGGTFVLSLLQIGGFCSFTS